MTHNKRCSLVVGAFLSFASMTCRAHDGVFQLLWGSAMGVQAAVNSAHLAQMSASVVQKSRHKSKARKAAHQQDLDQEIAASYRDDNDLLRDAEQADRKIEHNKRRLQDEDVRHNEEMQQQIKRNIRLLERVKEKAADIERAQRASEARQRCNNEGLGLGA